MTTDNKLQISRNLSLVLVFSLIVTIWFWWPQTGIPDAEKSEKRALADAPNEFAYNNFWQISSYANFFENHFVDTFPVRYHLIRFDKNIRYAVFDEKIISDVIVGDDNWLYWNSVQNTITCQQFPPFKMEELKKWSGILQQLDSKLEDRDIELYFHIAPAKCSIYPEYTGDQLALIGGDSQMDQFLEYMTTQELGIPIIDNRPSLIAEKANSQVYYRTDTHWSEWGAYIAYRDVIKTIFPDIEEEDFVPFESLTFQRIKPRTGALFGFLAIENGFREEIKMLELETDTTVEIQGKAHIYSNPSAPNDLTMLVFQDSFYRSTVSGVIYSLLAEHFQTTIFLDRNRGAFWNPESDELTAILDEWQPDILLVERTERNISSFALGDPFQGE